MVHTISAETFVAKQSDAKEKDELLVLDARDDAEFKTSHLADALNVQNAASDAELTELIQKRVAADGDIVCYCLMGGRGAKLAERVEGLVQSLPGAPKPTVHLLDGHLSAWALDGRPMVDADGKPTTEVNLDKAPASMKEKFAAMK